MDVLCSIQYPAGTGRQAKSIPVAETDNSESTEQQLNPPSNIAVPLPKVGNTFRRCPYLFNLQCHMSGDLPVRYHVRKGLCGILFLFFNAGCRRCSIFGVVAVVIRDSLASKSSQQVDQSSRDVAKGS